MADSNQDLAFQFQNSRMVDKEGFLTPEWKTIIERMIDFLTAIYSQTGIKTPNFTGDEVTRIESGGVDNTLENFTIYGDQNTNTLKVKLNDTFLTIQTAP